MSVRVITRTQYEELRGYEDGLPKWRYGGAPSKPLTRNGLLAIVPGSGHDRRSSFFRITEAGLAALAAYREQYGLRGGAK